MENEQVMIHVRFAADGSVTEIGERPAVLNAQDWFNRLSDSAGDAYNALSGGRGLFRLARGRVDEIKVGNSH
jgi:hypothetical protein